MENENKEEPKLKPVTYTSAYYPKGEQNTAQQAALLEAMQKTDDPQKLKTMVGLRSIAEVYRTLDKMSMRREYHDALARSGISFDFIVDGLKGVAVSADKDADKVNALKVLLKSLGMEKYDVSDTPSGSTWEEMIMKNVGKSEAKQLSPGNEEQVAEDAQEEADDIFGDYEVTAPEPPEFIKRMEEKEDDMSATLYG